MIKAIRMVNCQSWADTTIELATDKINVLCADNNSGKSVLFKMLKIAVCKDIYTKEERKSLIRYGASQATIMFLFDDDSIGITTVFNNRVLHRYSVDGKTFMESFDEPIPEVVHKLGILVNDDSSFIANIIDMDQPLLLINTKERENYELIKMLVTNKDLETLQERIETLQKEFKVQGQDLKIKIIELKDELSRHTYMDINKLENDLKSVELEYNAYNTLVDAYYKLSYLHSNFKEDPGYDQLIGIVDLLTILKQIESKISKIEIKQDVDERAIHVTNYFMHLWDSLQKMRVPKDIDFDSIERCMCLAEQINSITESVNSVKIIEHRDYNQIDREYHTLETLQNLGHTVAALVPLGDVDYDSIDRQFSTLEILHSLNLSIGESRSQLEKVARLSSDITQLENKIDSFDDVIDGCPVYGKVIYKNGKCILDNH